MAERIHYLFRLRNLGAGGHEQHRRGGKLYHVSPDGSVKNLAYGGGGVVA